MRQFLVRTLAFVGGLTLLGVALLVALIAVAVSHKPSVPSAVILETEFHRGLNEREDQGILETLGREKPTVLDVVEALDKAGDDPRVSVLISDLSHMSAGLAQIQEIRDALIAFRKKGKKAIAYADTFGELGPANGAYYLATAYDEVYVQPSGSVGFTGLAVELPFGKELLEKLGVQPVFFKRSEFKSAPEMFTEKAPTPSNREETEGWLKSETQQLIRGVAEARHLDVAETQKLLNRGPLLADEALKAKLVDGLAYRDEVFAKAREKAGESAKPLYLSVYLERAGRPNKDATEKVALIFGTGEVERGAPGTEVEQDKMRSGDLVAAFRDAVADKNVKAILFRIDSPGGSYTASDTIHRAVQLARKNGKPVIVSMGNVAASGGYFVAMDADKIVAEPGTLTGSIGVFSGKFITRDLWSKVGVNWTTFAQGDNAALMSSGSDFTPEQKVRMDAWLDAVYADFTGKAAKGRKLTVEQLQKIAKGRVWTGEDAQKLGLVDVLGGMETALALAKEAAKISPGTAVQLAVYPHPRTAVEEISQLISGRTGESSEEETRVSLPQLPQPSLEQLTRRWAAELGLRERGVLSSDAPAVRW